jgi:hypothetical protein
MRLATVVAALTLGSVSAYAQVAPPVDQSRRLLESQSLRDKAWGAWFAGASHDPTLLEPLLAQLLQVAQPLRNAQHDSEEYAYIQALFDALIQIPGPIPSEVILPFEQSWRTEILILLSRDPSADGAESALLEMREHSMPGPEWAAVNDLLFALSSKPFFQKTLEEIRVRHAFVVIDQGAGVAFCGGAIGCGASTRRFPSGFPPIALYQLWATLTQPGDILFQEQPIPIRYRRIVVPTDGQTDWKNCEGDYTRDRQSLLARFFSSIGGRSPDESYALFNPRTTISWHDSAQVAAEMEKVLSGQATSVQALIEDAQERDLVQASGLHLTIETTPQDLRSDRTVPLPTAAPHEIVIP